MGEEKKGDCITTQALQVIEVGPSLQVTDAAVLKSPSSALYAHKNKKERNREKLESTQMCLPQMEGNARGRVGHLLQQPPVSPPIRAMEAVSHGQN